MSEHDVKKEHLKTYYRNQQGRDYITYPGLLAEFHLQNDEWMKAHPDAEDRRGIIATLTQVPTPDNGMVAIAAATVTMSSGATYADIGDADDNNVNRMIANARMRMAATRAKGRALRDATNIGTTMYEELPGTGADTDPEKPETPPRRNPETDMAPMSDGDFETPPPNTNTGGDWKAATEKQAKMIYAICMDLGVERSKIPARGVVEQEWSYEKASKYIDRLKAEQERRSSSEKGVSL